LDALAEATQAAGDLGSLRAKVLVPLGKAQERTNEGRDLCAGSDRKKAKNRLKQVSRQLIQYSHRLRGKSARKFPAEVRDPLAAAADQIGTDTKALRSALACPNDAT
jgi:hypothetical protein